METLFAELKRYVGWNAADEDALRAFHPGARPQFERIVDVFYRRIREHAEAKKALEGGESQLGRLKTTLLAWMNELFTGPWDEAYYERRARIGRVHVRIGLPQHYMFGAMDVLHRELAEVIEQVHTDGEQRRAARVALTKIVDLELAIMLHTYREDLLAQGARNERLATFGQLVGSIGHELRNPLGVIESSLYILRGRVGPDERGQKHVERISEQLGIANQIITDLLDMIRDRPLDRKQVRVGAIVDDVLSVVSRPPGVRLAADGIGALPEIEVDASKLRQVFFNLVENAVHAVGPTGEVHISGVATASEIVFSVEDSGPGVDLTVRARLFEPLITTKAKGIGLGLPLVRRIVERHGGTIVYDPPLTGGARFVVRLPRGGHA
jgi:signal transduction histidine kinase